MTNLLTKCLINWSKLSLKTLFEFSYLQDCCSYILLTHMLYVEDLKYCSFCYLLKLNLKLIKKAERNIPLI